MLKQPCKFYNTSGKCRFGKHCKFSHALGISQEASSSARRENEAVNKSATEGVSADSLPDNQSVNSKNDGSLTESNLSKLSLEQKSTDSHSHGTDETENGSLKEGKQVAKEPTCRFFAQNKFCHFGRRCRFLHVLPARQPDKRNESLVKTKVDLKEDEAEKDALAGDKMQDEVITRQTARALVDEKETKKKACKFFKQGFCRFGKNCHFYHPTKSESTTRKETSDVKKAEPVPLNRHSESENAPKLNEMEGFQPVVRNKPRVIHVYNKDEVDKDKLTELRRTELQQLKRRFPSGKIKVIEETDVNAAYVFTFQPTDPDWPFDVNTFDIRVDFSANYPDKLFAVSLPTEQDLPETVRRYVEVSLKEWVDKRAADNEHKHQIELLFRPFLRWMDRNMETMVTEGLRQLRRELTAKAAGLEFISATDLKKDTGANQASGDSGDSHAHFDECSDEGDALKDARRPVAYRKVDLMEEKYEVPQHQSGDEAGSDDDSSDSEPGTPQDDVAGHKRPAVPDNVERKGTELVFRSMQIWYCTTVMMEKLRLVVQCERCKNRTDFSTPPNRVNLVPCAKCNNRQLIVFRPTLAHSYCSTFGYLDLEGCAGFDVILQDCHFSMGCIMCSRDVLVKKFCPGRVLDIFCRSCHSKMQFAADSVKLQVLTPGEVDPSKFSGSVHQVAVKRMNRVQKDPAIQEGKALPDNGACKHYKKSFRWLRFPCCGKCFPCDLCHDDKEDHEMKFANRMICGFCCREQPYSAERPCSGCSSALTKVRSAHWEGGKGCRNKISMSRTDEKKYSNMNKTQSNKARAQQEKKQGGQKSTKLRHT